MNQPNQPNELDRALRDWTDRRQDRKNLDSLTQRIVVALQEETPQGGDIQPAKTAGIPPSGRFSRSAAIWLSITAAAAAIFVACWLIFSRGKNGEVAQPEPIDPGVAERPETLPPEFAWLEKSQLAEKAVLLQEMERLFDHRLQWIAETDGRVLLEVQDRGPGGGEEHSNVPMAARVVVVRWNEQRPRWTPVWAVDVLVRQDQVVRLSLDRAGAPHGTELSLWAYPVDERTIAVDSNLSLSRLALESSFNGIQQSGVPVAMHSIRQGDTQYRVFQTVVRLDGEA